MRIIQLWLLTVSCLVFSLPVTTDFARARELAKAYQKPLAIVFTGSEWDETSKKMCSDVLENPEFVREIGNTCIFVHLDFSTPTGSSNEMIINNCARQEYHVEMLPTVILIDPDNMEICRTGYFPISGKEYALHIKTKLKEYLDLQNSTSHDYLSLYHRAQKLGCDRLEQQFIQAGLDNERSPELLIEEYSRLVRKQEDNCANGFRLRDEIVSIAPPAILSRLAMLDYQRTGDVSFLEKASEERPDWRLMVIIAEHYVKKGEMKKSLSFARKAAETAPDDSKLVIQAQIDHSLGEMQ